MHAHPPLSPSLCFGQSQAQKPADHAASCILPGDAPGWSAVRHLTGGVPPHTRPAPLPPAAE